MAGTKKPPREESWASRWQGLGWDHDVWPLVRYFRALQTTKRPGWLDALATKKTFEVMDGASFTVSDELAEKVAEYIPAAEAAVESVKERLRTESEANQFCQSLGVDVGVTRTQSADHHQATKPLVAAVGEIARRVCERRSLQFVANPQGRAVWLARNHLHASARRLDGAVASLVNPFAVWEIKEYWGGGEGKAGGSKMSDAVYECHLVGQELRTFERKAGLRVHHFVFVDGRQQWNSRRSDLLRLLDLEAQGFIDRLFVGRDVEFRWEPALERSVAELGPR